MGMSNVISVQNGAVLFVGKIPDLPFHSTLTTALVVGLENEMETRVEGERRWLKSPSFIFNGDLSHESRFRGAVGIILADPGSSLGKMMRRESGRSKLAKNPEFSRAFAKKCIEIADGGRPESILSTFFDRKPTIDKRLHSVLTQLIRNPEDSSGAAKLAAGIGMSSSWLQHEFTHAVGLPLRAFRRWFRMKRAVVSLNSGLSIAEAALAGGFYDQAHFTNVFKGIFGLSPTAVFQGREPIRWHADDQLT